MSDTIGFENSKWFGYFLDFANIVKELQERGVLVAFFQTPLVKNIRNLSDFEKKRIENWQFDFNNISDADYKYIAKVYEAGADVSYLKKVYDGTKVFSKNGIRYLADFRGELVNIINGERFTVGQPASYKRTVYVYGQCTARGTGVEDKNTIPSFLQKFFNKNRPEAGIVVRNRAIGCGSDIHDDVARAREDCPRQGDVVVFCTDLRIVPLELFKENKILYYDCSPLFNRPHNYGEWFTDATFHTTPAGNRVIAEYIFDILEKNDNFMNYIEGEDVYSAGVVQKSVFDEVQIKPYLETLAKYRKDRLKCGAIIMNCNPLTKGHLYLIETAASQVGWLYIFVVEEDRSFFKFEDRINLVRQGTAGIGNITVLPSGRFVLSADTFPGYFYKDNNTDINVDASLDIEVFGKYVAPELDITVRFVGEEPLDPVTAVYNRQMHEILPGYGIEVREIKRREFDGKPISASWVRKLLDDKSFGGIKSIVPEVTYQFLVKNYG